MYGDGLHVSSSNCGQFLATTLIETNVLPLHQAATSVLFV